MRVGTDLGLLGPGQGGGLGGRGEGRRSEWVSAALGQQDLRAAGEAGLERPRGRGAGR